jgi:cytochrome c-type biogenesis protein
MSPVAYVALFGAGVASFVAPCVVPLVPAYVAVVAGEATAGPRRLVPGAILFVGGLSVVFVAFGTLAATFGASLYTAQAWLARVGGVLLVVFGLVLLGVLKGWLARDRRLRSFVASGPVARPVLLGLTFGAAWTPCVGPLLGAALVVAARSADAWQGASLLAAYALGIGVPFVAVALLMASSPGLLRSLQRASVHVERVAGALLVILGVLLLTGTYDRFIGPLARLVPTT